MSYGSYNWTFEELNVFNDASSEGGAKFVNVEFTLICTDPGCAPSGQFGPPEYYDPGEGATWEIEVIEITFDTAKPLTVTEQQFSELFPNADDMMNNAIEAAAENGIVEAEEPDYD